MGISIDEINAQSSAPSAPKKGIHIDELDYSKLYAQKAEDDALRQRLQGESWMSRNLEGLMTAPSNLLEGVKQFGHELANPYQFKNPQTGEVSPVPYTGSQPLPRKEYDTSKIRQNRVIASEAPVGAITGGVATALPLAFLPGGNRMAGQAVYGAMLGAAEPTLGDESRMSNMAIGGLTGLTIPASIKIASALRKDPAELAREALVNSTKDTSTKEALNAGYTIPRSMYNASFLTDRLESLAGKAATKQQAGAENQKITNDLARKYLGLPENAPLSPDVLEQLRTTAAAPYREASALPAGTVGITSAKSLATGGTTQSPIVKTGEQLVNELKIAREDARAAWKASKMSEKPAQARQQAEALDSHVATLENQLNDLAKANNQPDLVQRLNEARQNIAKVHTIDKAMNDATGEINAQELLKMQNKNVPLTGEAKQIADFASAYPELAKPGAKIPTAGVSKSEALAALLLGGVGHAATGNFMGTLLSTLPLLSHPARAAALSKTLQKMPNYNEGMVSKALNELSKLPLSQDQIKKYGFALSQGLSNTNQGEQ